MHARAHQSTALTPNLHLVLAGAGHAQPDLLAALSRRRRRDCDVTLITSQPAFHSTTGRSLSGVDAHAFAMRQFSAALGLITKLDAAIDASAPGAIISSVVVGGGAAGFGIACAVRARILVASRVPRVTIIDASARDGLPLAGFAVPTRRLASRALSSRGIRVVAGSVTAVHTDAVTLTDASVTRDIASAATAWVPGPAAHPWLASSVARVTLGAATQDVDRRALSGAVSRSRPLMAGSTGTHRGGGVPTPPVRNR